MIEKRNPWTNKNCLVCTRCIAETYCRYCEYECKKIIYCTGFVQKEVKKDERAIQTGGV